MRDATRKPFGEKMRLEMQNSPHATIYFTPYKTWGGLRGDGGALLSLLLLCARRSTFT